MMSLSAGKRKPTTWTLGRFTEISAFAALSNPHRPAVPPFAARTPAAQSCGVFPHGGQCFSFERSGSCRKPACPYKHSCARCSGAHQTSNCRRHPPPPPLPKVIVSPSSHTLPTPSKGTCSRHTCCIMMNMNQQSLSQGSPWGFPFTTMAHITHAPPEIIGLLSRLLL